MITARRRLAGAGTQNAALAISGHTPTNVTCTEAYNGSTWAAGGAVITGRPLLAAAGVQNAALAFAGDPSPLVNCTEAYNGTAWSVRNGMIVTRRDLGGAGLANAALAFGGGPTAVACTEAFTAIQSCISGSSAITFNIGQNNLTTAAWSAGCCS
jgi:hypothetical protein